MITSWDIICGLSILLVVTFSALLIAWIGVIFVHVVEMAKGRLTGDMAYRVLREKVDVGLLLLTSLLFGMLLLTASSGI
jgi:hypothetical protein